MRPTALRSGSHRPRPWAWPVAFAALLAALPAICRAQDDAPLKAAIVFSLLQFVQWPAEAAMPDGAPLHLCVDKGSPLWPHLRPLQDRPLRQGRLDVRDMPAADGIRQCHAWLADGGAPARRLPARAAAAAPLLVIGDGDGADDAGVTIGLHMNAQRVVFDIDLAAARQSGLQVSSKLLRLARKVRE